MKAVGKCDIGKHRKNNEDKICIFHGMDESVGYFIVADGMGGHNGGEVASAVAVSAFKEYVLENEMAYFENFDVLDLFVAALAHANEAILQLSENESELSGMGTTFIAAAIKNNKLFAVHIGDSRLYVLEYNKLRQLSKDHSYVMEMVRLGRITPEEALTHPKRNIITRSLGGSEVPVADTIIEDLDGNWSVLMCTDGLSGMVTDTDIENILKSHKPLDAKVDALIDMANVNGGLDNISAIIISKEVGN